MKKKVNIDKIQHGNPTVQELIEKIEYYINIFDIPSYENSVAKSLVADVKKNQIINKQTKDTFLIYAKLIYGI